METTKQVLDDMKKVLRDQYSAQLVQFGTQKKTRESLEAGFADGLNTGVHHVLKMLGVTIKE